MSDNVPLTTGFGAAAKTGILGGVATVGAAFVAGVALGTAAVIGGPVGAVAAGALVVPVAGAIQTAGIIGTSVAMAKTVIDKRDEYKQAHPQIQTVSAQFDGRAQHAPALATSRNGG